MGVMLRTDDAGQWTMDAGPSAPYYKLTGELKTQIMVKYENCVLKEDIK